VLNKRPRPAKAFTLVGLLVVIGIISVLIGILLPTISAARRQANTTACAATLRGLGQALAGYTTEFKSYPWAAYYSGSALSNLDASDGSDSPIDQVTYVWWSVIRGYMRGHGAPINNVVTDSTGRPLTRYMEAFSCPAGQNREAGCDFVCNGAIMPWEENEKDDSQHYHFKNKDISKPAKPSGVYPDNIILFDACELGNVDPQFSRQYLTSFDLDATPPALSYTANPKKPLWRYRGNRNLDSDPKLGDGWPINPGPNNDSGTSGAQGQIRWRHGRQDLANFLFADGSVKSMKITRDYNDPNKVKGEVLRKYLRPKQPQGYVMINQN